MSAVKAKYKDLKELNKDYLITASRLAELLGKPKKTLLRWLKGNPETITDIDLEKVQMIKELKEYAK